MTDKELKKLSRLELLEILLEESKENERLRGMIDKAEKENSSGYSEGVLIQLTGQLNGVLSEANRLVCELRDVKKGSATVENANDVMSPDTKLYWRLMYFYSQNKTALAFLPPDIQEDVIRILRGIANARK